MAELIDPFIGVKWGYADVEDGWGPGMNENLIKLAFFQNRRIDGSIGALPGSPSDGDAYFLTTDQRIYYRADSTWYSSTVPVGFEFILKSTEAVKIYDGTATLADPEVPEVLELSVSSVSKAKAVTTGVAVNGVLSNLPTTPLSAQDANVQLRNAANWAVADLGFSAGDSTLKVHNLQRSGKVRISGRDASGVDVDFATMDPVSGNTMLMVGGTEVARVVEGASGGLLARNEITGAGLERVLTTGDLIAAGAGDTVGPAGATDNALARFNTTTGKLLQNSVGTLSDAGDLAGLKKITSTDDIQTSGKIITQNGLVFLGDADTWIDSPAADTISIVTGGVTRASFSSSFSNFTSPIQESGVPLASTYARLGQKNTFTGTEQVISGILPRLTLLETDVVANDQKWLMTSNGGDFRISASNFGESVMQDAIEITRDDAIIGDVNFPNGTLKYGGVEVATVNDLSPTEDIQDIVGAMVGGNTEDGISVTYNDGSGKLDFDVQGINATHLASNNISQFSNDSGYITASTPANFSGILTTNKGGTGVNSLSQINLESLNVVVSTSDPSGSSTGRIWLKREP